MQYLTEDLLSSVKLRTLMPTSQATFQDADLITLANEEMQLKLVGDIMSERENFFLTSELRSVLAGVDTYTMSSRSIGNSLKAVWFIDSLGNKKRLTQLGLETLPNFAVRGDPQSFYIAGDEVITLPMPVVTGGSLRYDFYARPNKLVATSTCAKATSKSTALGLTTFTVDTDLSATLSVGSLVDFVSMTSPFLLWAYQVPVTAITSTTIQVSSALISDQAGNVQPINGDYICPTGTANIPQVPQEFHPVLAQMIANTVLLGLGDMQKYQLGEARLKEDRANALKLIKNRVESSPLKITTPNGLVSSFTRRTF